MSFHPSDIDRIAKLDRLGAERREAETALQPAAARPVSGEEIDRLRAQGNSAADWARVRVADDFRTDAIWGSRFEGDVSLGRFDSAVAQPGRPQPGIYHSTISDCAIGDDARVARCNRLERTIVGRGAHVEDVGRITLTGDTSDFGCSLELFNDPFFSRRLLAFPELPFAAAVWATGPEASSPEAQSDLTRLFKIAEAYARAMRADRGFIGEGAAVLSARVIENCWIGRGVRIDGAGWLRNCTFWAEPDEPTLIRDGAQVGHALIGPGCLLEALCCVDEAILFEHVQVGAQAVIKGSAIAPNVRLSESEINESLVGPFTTAIHHSLLIASWWPEGKGNVAYGANVGSNHTGRAPDQELWPGEGTFFGLGVNIKFPTNLRESPYTIIATGVDTLPQKVSFPFSLISPPAATYEDLSPAINEIRPGWALLHNAYGLERQQQNLLTRNKARRTPIELNILRPSLIDAMRAAGRRLEEAGSGSPRVRTSADIEGLGKNYLTEAGRIEGIEAYEFGRRVGAARRLLGALDSAPRGPSQAEPSPSIAEIVSWAGAILGSADPEQLVQRAIEAEKLWLDRVRSSRERDWTRGVAILDDYAQRHVGLDEDSVILAATARLEQYESVIDQAIAAAAQLLADRAAG